MEMDSSRRPTDRSILKKPRLIEGVERDRGPNGLVERERPGLRGASGPLLPRYRLDREGERGRTEANEESDNPRENSGRGAQFQQQHHLQELLSQYKTALAELTFNSKPIITNLTIIAGENTHAAKWIAATVCGNILEVPSEQKLPSLYLLDSIVKNIGGDYIKYFAARLPDVFCKAYRQVDPSIHAGMHHLFRTWKGVFPPAPLQIIEKQLDFPPATNSSSSGAPASRPDSQRPPHSIHVNPKYLEARQRLQQSSRAKGISADNNGVSLADHMESSDRAMTSGSPKQWPDLPVKNIQRPQSGEPLSESLFGKKPSTGYGDYKFASDRARRSDIRTVRSIERVVEKEEGLDRGRYGGVEGTTTNPPFGPKNGHSMPQLPQRGLTDAYGSHRPSRPAHVVPQLPPPQDVAGKSGRGGISRNWKNSEEEEYMWDDMNSRLTEHGGADRSSKDPWVSDDAGNPTSMTRGKWMPSESDPLDANWNSLETSSRLEKPIVGEDGMSLKREPDDPQLQSHGQQDIDPRSRRDTSAESPSQGGGPSEFERRLLSGWPPQQNMSMSQLRPRIHPVDGLIQTGLPTSLASSSFGKAGNQSNLGMPLGSIPSSFGPTSQMIPGSSGLFGHQRQQPQRPPSPSSQLPFHHLPYSSQIPLHQPPSLHDLDPMQQAQAQSFTQPGQKGSQAINQSTQNQDSFSPKRHNSSILQSLQAPLQIQPPLRFHGASSSLLPPSKQGHHQLHFGQPPNLEIPHAQPPTFGPPRTSGYSGAGLPKNLPVEPQGQSSTETLLATILQSGILPLESTPSNTQPLSTSSSAIPRHSDSMSTPSNLNIQPPLPTGPPPIPQTSSLPVTSVSSLLGPNPLGNMSSLSTQPVGMLQPPLPPGPPPASSIAGSSQASSTASGVSNQLSGLLSSLVAKGLISAPTSESSNPPVSHAPTEVQHQTAVVATSATSMLSSRSLVSSTPPTSIPIDEPELWVSTSISSAPPQAPRVDTKDPITMEPNLIGIEFKPEVIRERHPSVISGLFDAMPHRCSACGLRFNRQEELSKHLEWHASKNHEQSSGKRVLRNWYVSLRNWVEGDVGPSTGDASFPLDEKLSNVEKEEPVVPADESQCICILCGEPFEDYYSHERDEWMYKGATYMSGNGGDGSSSPVSIVHVNCISKGAADDLLEAENDNVVCSMCTHVCTYVFRYLSAMSVYL
ncbi:hypothetical protein AMTRI_Chr11g150260 [Amborella trichopoda]